MFSISFWFISCAALVRVIIVDGIVGMLLAVKGAGPHLTVRASHRADGPKGMPV
jgi:hypothetical protein